MAENLIEQFIGAIKQEPVKENNRYSAVVSKIDNEGVVWVYVAGSELETPVASSAVEVKKGEAVTVEWRNNRLYVEGNTSNPAAGTTRVAAVEVLSNKANDAALQAVGDAAVARGASEQAQASAAEAKTSADQAQASASEAMESASNASEAASAAGTAAANASEKADLAADRAEAAQQSADSAISSANTALVQLSEVENVLKVLDWAATHGTYALTEDTAAKEGKWYFELINGEYSVVSVDASVDPSAQGYYELTGVDEAISNYINTHLALSSSGLWLQMDDTKARLQITPTGMTLWNDQGRPIAQYGTDIVLGDASTTHIKLDNNELGFYKDENTRVAYISGNKLFISESEVTNNLRIGEFMWIVQSAQRISLRYSPQ